MRSKGNAPNAEQKRWLEKVAGLGSIISGGPAEIHHPVGLTAKHNKVHIGHWWLIPLTPEEHRIYHGHQDELERKHFGLEFVGRWDGQKILFKEVCESLGGFPGPDEAYLQVMNYHR